MKLLVSGGTGGIGGVLLPELSRLGHSGAVLTRAPQSARLPTGFEAVEWDARSLGAWQRQLSQCDAVVHLAGQGVFDRRWSQAYKREVFDSRVQTTRLLAQALTEATPRPALFVSASAVGFYGDTGEARTDETGPPGDDFLADLCVAWERESEAARSVGVRVVNPRIGIVLQREHGALAQMLPLFRAFVGGYFGSGQAWFPWIHIADLISGLVHPLVDEKLSGPVNLVAPGEVRFREFTKILARRLSRPSWPIPSLAARLRFGEAANALLASQRIQPALLQRAGFEFRFPDADAALADLLS